MLSGVCDGKLSLQDALTSDVISQLEFAAENWNSTMAGYRTSKLWMMYMHLISILRAFIRSARTGNWKLYLQSLHEMLPFMAAAGHNNYTKSLVLYLDKMDNLELTHPLVYDKFMEGLFVVRQTDHHWSGLFTDLYIEQVLMGSIKSLGGLTRGRGFDESTSLIWSLSSPACAEVHRALQEVTGLSGVKSGQMHKDLSQARLAKDAKDLQCLLNYFQERKPFSKDTKELRSLESGVIAEGSVNVDSAEEVGNAILASMEGKTVSEYTFSKKNQAVNIASSVYVSVSGETVEIDPHQLYQRLLVAGIGTIDFHTLFQFELCSYPASLFDTKLLMRQADKADLQNGLLKKVPSCIVNEVPVGVVYVIDGGAMLQRLPWPKAISYRNLCQLYVQFVRKHYHDALIVFDGYSSGPSTKDETHQRRSGSEVGVNVDFKPDMLLTMKKKAFLANPQNKQRFINLLGCELEKEKGKKVTHSSGDADFDIVKSACILAQNKPVVVVGGDTDVLILLQHQFSATEHETIYIQTSSKIINIFVLKQSHTPELSLSLLFIHALSGCDTTSWPFGIGKQSALAKYQKLQNLAKMFMMADRSHEEIEQAGNKALVVLYECT